MNEEYDTEICKERKKWQHLRLDDRGAIETLHKLGMSLRKIGNILHVAPNTVRNELKRGTPKHTEGRGRPPVYKARRGQKAYENNRKRCKKQSKLSASHNFILWLAERIRFDKWSIDASVGYAHRQNVFAQNEMVCTKTVYNFLHAQLLPLTKFDVPMVLKRCSHKKRRLRINKRTFGRSIEERALILAHGPEFGHWEIDTVIGKKRRESCVLTLAEKQTNTYLAIRIAGKNSQSVMAAMQELRWEYGERFHQVFKTITADNGSEFSELSRIEEWGTKVYFTHPFSSWERAQNERLNGMLRTFIPKGRSINEYTNEDVLVFADKLNAMPRRSLGYKTPEELFEDILDEIYTDKKGNQ